MATYAHLKYDEAKLTQLLASAGMPGQTAPSTPLQFTMPNVPRQIFNTPDQADLFLTTFTTSVVASLVGICSQYGLQLDQTRILAWIAIICIRFPPPRRQAMAQKIFDLANGRTFAFNAGNVGHLCMHDIEAGQFVCDAGLLRAIHDPVSIEILLATLVGRCFFGAACGIADEEQLNIADAENTIVLFDRIERTGTDPSPYFQSIFKTLYSVRAQQTTGSFSYIDCLQANVKKKQYAIPDTIGGRYKPLAVLGEGGMGIVFLAKNQETGTKVAVKIMKGTEEELSRFIREVRLIKDVNHAYVINIESFNSYGEAESRHAYYAMRYCPWPTLKQLMDPEIGVMNVQGGKPTLRRRNPGKYTMIEYIRMLCETLIGIDAIHRHDLVHRDIKPENIKYDVETRSPTIMDFGLVKSIAPADNTITLSRATIARMASEERRPMRTMQGTMMGTPGYMSPEQAEDSAEVDTRADIFSAGVMLYEMLTGQRPFVGRNMHEVLANTLSGKFVLPSRLNPAIDAQLEAIICKALAKNPDERFLSARDMRTALENFLVRAETEPEAGAVRPAPRLPKPVKRRASIQTAPIPAVLPVVDAEKTILANQPTILPVARVPTPPPAPLRAIPVAVAVPVGTPGGPGAPPHGQPKERERGEQRAGGPGASASADLRRDTPRTGSERGDQTGRSPHDRESAAHGQPAQRSARATDASQATRLRPSTIAAAAIVVLAAVVAAIVLATRQRGSTAPASAGSDIARQQIAVPSPSPTQSKLDLTSGLILHWKLDEKMGITAIDSSGNGHHGTLRGTARFAGGDSRALRLTDDSAMLLVDNVVDLGQDWTIAAWFTTPLPATAGGWRTLTRGKDAGHHVIVDQDSRLGTYMAGAFFPCGYSLSVLPKGWHHLTAVGSATSTKYFVDGVPVGTSNRKSVLAVNCVGNYQNGGQRFSEAISAVRIYNRALSAAEAVQLATLDKPPPLPAAPAVSSIYKPRSLILHWKFDEKDGTTAADSSGNGNNGETRGSPTRIDGKLGGGLEFDGVDDFCEGPTQAFNNISNTFSIVFWARPLTNRVWTYEASSGTFGTVGQRWAIFPRQGEATYGRNHATAGVSVGTDGVSVFEHGAGYFPSLLVHDAVLGAWTHIAVVYEDRTPTLYLNGSVVRTGLRSTWTVHPGSSIASVRENMYPCHYRGSLDDIRIYNYALSAAEVAGLVGTNAVAAKAEPPKPVAIPTPNMLTLVADQKLGTAAGWNDLVGGNDSITHHPDGIYDWANKDGANKLALAGLNMNGFSISNDAGRGIVLNMRGNALTNGGRIIAASDGWVFTGGITITNATDIVADSIVTAGCGPNCGLATYRNPTSSCGGIFISHQGRLELDCIDIRNTNDFRGAQGEIILNGNCGGARSKGRLLLTNKSIGINADLGGHFAFTNRITILGYEDVAIKGKITSVGPSYGVPSYVRIGKDTTNAEDPEAIGRMSVGGIDLRSDTSRQYSGPFDAGGRVELYARSDILMQDDTGSPKHIVNASDYPQPVTVRHNGSFVAGIIDSHTLNNYHAANPPDVLCDGNILGKAPSGSFRVSRISTYSAAASGTTNSRAGDVTVRGYSEVVIGPSVSGAAIETYSSPAEDRPIRAGNIDITNITGNIRINGAVNATSIGKSAESRKGRFNIACQGPGSTITLSSLDLNLVSDAILDTGSGKSIVTSALLNFPIATPANGKLDAPAGQKIFYNATLPANAYLTNGTYTLKSGGVLMPEGKAVAAPAPAPEPATPSKSVPWKAEWKKLPGVKPAGSPYAARWWASFDTKRRHYLYFEPDFSAWAYDVKTAKWDRIAEPKIGDGKTWPAKLDCELRMGVAPYDEKRNRAWIGYSVPGYRNCTLFFDTATGTWGGGPITNGVAPASFLFGIPSRNLIASTGGWVSYSVLDTQTLAWTHVKCEGESVGSIGCAAWDTKRMRLVVPFCQSGGMRVLDPTSNKWIKLESTNHPISGGPRIAYDAGNDLLVLAGTIPVGAKEYAGQNDVWAYDESTRSWFELAVGGDTPPLGADPRSLHGVLKLQYDAEGRQVLGHVSNTGEMWSLKIESTGKTK